MEKQSVGHGKHRVKKEKPELFTKKGSTNLDASNY